MSTYYETSNAQREYDGVEFEPYAIFGGCLYGVAVAAKPETEAILKALASDPKSGVTEITEEQYAAAVKKKAQLSSNYSSSTPRQVQPKAQPRVISGSGAAVVETGPLPDQKVLEATSADEVVKVQPIPSEAKPSKPSKKKVTADEREPSNVG
jgi:hypothetical protein